MIPNINLHNIKISPTIHFNYKYPEGMPIKFNLNNFLSSMNLEEPIIAMNTDKKSDDNNIFYTIGNKFGHFTKLVMNKVDSMNKNQNKSLLTQFELGNENFIEPTLNKQENNIEIVESSPIKAEISNSLNNIISKIQKSNEKSLTILKNGLLETIKNNQQNSQKGQLSFDFGPTEDEKLKEKQENLYNIGNKLGNKFKRFSNLMMKTISDLNESKNSLKKSISNNIRIEPTLLSKNPTENNNAIAKSIEIKTEPTNVVDKNQLSPIVQAQNTLNLESATAYVGLKATQEATKEHLKNTINIFKQIASNLSVKINQVADVPNTISHFFTLSGEEKNIKKLQKNHAELFKIIGFQSESLLSNSSIKNNGFSLTEQEKDISKVINEKFNFNSNTNKFITLESNTQANVKIAYLEKVVFPKIKEEIQNILTFTENINDLASKNIYLTKLNKFSEKYEFDKDAVLHLLRTNPNELKNIAKDKDFNDLINNKQLILDNYDNYQTICANHITYSKQIFNIYNTLTQEIPKNDKQGVAFLKNHIQDSYLFSKNGKGYKVEDVAKNIMETYNYLKQDNELKTNTANNKPNI